MVCHNCKSFRLLVRSPGGVYLCADGECLKKPEPSTVEIVVRAADLDALRAQQGRLAQQ